MILVDENDQEIGTCEKLKAHEYGYLHRAYSVFLFNDQNELLMQKRASTKYHSGGLWTNTVCSHPIQGIDLITCAQNRLMEELGISSNIPDLTPKLTLLYHEEVDQGLIEHEFDHVLIGHYNDLPMTPNPEEVEAVKYSSIEAIDQQLQVHPEQFTIWFQLLWPRIAEQLQAVAVLR